jgi:hypothetical protein
MYLWGEAAMTTIYVQNRSPHCILKDMTPEETFSRKKPNVKNLRIFGFPIYIHIPKDKRKKLEPSGKKGIFVGYNESSKAYRIYIPEQHKVEVSRDVTFNEKMAFKKSIEETIEEEEYEEPKDESTCLPEVRMKKQNNLINRCNHVKLLNQSLYPKPRNVQLGLKLLYKKQKDSKPQVAPSEKEKSPKDSPAMQHV